MVGVISADYDKPPRACWLKGRVMRATAKEGVRACWPSTPPKDLEGQAVTDMEEHQERLKAVSALSSPGVVPSHSILLQRAEAIRAATRHAWSAYVRLAWGKDEVKPVSSRALDSVFGHAVTMVDALSTLWIMGFKEEFQQAREWLVINLPGRLGKLVKRVSVFETTIRTLGGLLSAYDLSRDSAFLDLAKMVGKRIRSLTSSAGVTPYTFGRGNGGSKCKTLTDSGTNQLEFRYLARETGDKSWSESSDRFYDMIRGRPSVDGLWPNCWESGKGRITMGADGDSFYEYLLKVWLFSGQTEDVLWDMYDRAVTGLEKHMLQKGPDGLTYVHHLSWTGRDVPKQVEEMEHLMCFLPGWLSLGASMPRANATRKRRLALAESIANTCWHMYHHQPTGLGPERVKSMQMDLSKTDTREYILRPEAAEGWWYMYELTGAPQYREWGWQTFVAMEKVLWTANGYASLKDVRDKKRGYLDRMESFFIAETLKYLFLLQDPNNKIKLDKYIFNTEGHPLSISKLPG